jgi:hypothetical protein
MTQTIPAARRVMLILATAWLSGCASDPLHDDGLEQADYFRKVEPYRSELPESYVLPAPDETDRGDPYSGIVGGAHQFELLEEREVDGRLLKKGSGMWGLHLRDRWVRYPQFEHAVFWRSDFAFVWHHGDPTLRRLDLRTDQEEVTPFTNICYEKYRPTYATGPDPFDPAVQRVGFLDDAGRTLAVHGRAHDTSRLRGGAWVIHHRTVTGAPYDVIYDAQGVAISPELAPLVDFGDTFAARLDPERELYWLIQPDGTVATKDEELLGLEPIYNGRGEERVVGWSARWRTPRGERLALGALGRQVDAVYLDIAAGEYHDTEIDFGVQVWIVRREDAHGYEIIEHGRPRLERTFLDVEHARSFLPALNTMREQAARALNEQYERERAQELAARLEESRRAVEQLVAEGNFAAARHLANKNFDFRSLCVAVVASIQAGQGAFVPEGDLHAARVHAQGDHDRASIDRMLAEKRAAVAAAESAAAQVAMSDWEYFWHGPAGGSGGGAPSDPGGAERLAEHLETVRRQNQDAWLRGAQSWGARTDR